MTINVCFYGVTGYIDNYCVCFVPGFLGLELFCLCLAGHGVELKLGLGLKFVGMSFLIGFDGWVMVTLLLCSCRLVIL